MANNVLIEKKVMALLFLHKRKRRENSWFDLSMGLGTGKVLEPL